MIKLQLSKEYKRNQLFIDKSLKKFLLVKNRICQGAFHMIDMD